MKLTGIEIRNYRSIGNEPVILNPWKKCNILIGQNNAGKSNVLRAVEKIFNKFIEYTGQKEVILTDTEYHALDQKNQLLVDLWFTTEKKDVEFKTLANNDSFRFQFSNKQGHRAFDIVDLYITDIQNNYGYALDLLESATRQRYSGGLSKDWLREQYLLHAYKLFNLHFESAIYQAHHIPVFRQIQFGDSYEYDGSNLIELLGQYQHPDSGKDPEQKKFENIEKLLQRLLHRPDAHLEVTHDKQVIMVKTGNLRLPLNSYGTGIHQLVILATAILSMENCFCCIEEPEIHLHPTLQREFIKFLIEETSNQYLISTHSSTFINAHVNMPPKIAEQMQVFHIQLKDGATIGYPVLDDAQSLIALNDLGVRASDILQTNCVIWVEGPSDRIYLNHWLSLVASDLIEGLHYSIMFYGGRLLSHLSLKRPTEEEKVPEELVEILKINQHSIVVMDSDRKKPRAHINATKRRVRDECEKSGGIYWVTDGREVENYLPARVVIAAFPELHGLLSDIGEYESFDEYLDEACRKARIKHKKYGEKKVDYARELIKHFDESHINKELHQQLDIVVAKIRDWNR